MTPPQEAKSRVPAAPAAAPSNASPSGPGRARNTPAMQQYLNIKAMHPDAILFFQMGDFFEMFYEDALQASKILDITLTSRQSDVDGPIPMCGVPRHAADAYLGRLLDASLKIAVCEQVEDSAEAKGVVRREVVRVLSPGTNSDPNFLESKEGCYLAGIAPGNQGGEPGWGIALADISTGEFRACEVRGEKADALLADEFERLRPREILCPKELEALPAVLRELRKAGARVEERAAAEFRPARGAEAFAEQFPDEEDLAEKAGAHPAAAGAAAALLGYLRENHPVELPHLRPPAFYRVSDTMHLDAVTQQNLELVRPAVAGERGVSLLGLLDKTCTGMGGRLLKKWVLAPLLSVGEIGRRADAVEETVNAPARLEALREALGRVHDFERILGRVGLQTANARDLAGLRASLSALPEVEGALAGASSAELAGMRGSWDSVPDIEEDLAVSLTDEPPLSLREGGLFRDGVDEELDRYRRASREGKDWLASYETEERDRTGLPLRVGFNKVFGYYIELSKRFSDSVPAEYSRKQTLVSAERYVTAELKKIEDDLLGAEEKAKNLEYALFGRLRGRIAAQSRRILAAAERVGRIDALASLAEAAVRGGYVRPVLDEGDTIEIIEGRHPVMEADPSLTFVPNDLRLNAERQILILTGPNMAGKSTYLRQVALLVLMAQMGGFVPARSARMGLVDRVFTRVGAHDRLLEGKSTFMVEMVETAAILREATPRSLVVLDEVGRGTSTFDGVSIAWAVVEYLHEAEAHRARTLFATHYHELAELASVLPRVSNLTVEVREWGEEVVFLRRVVEGSCDRSYGIHVGRLAGLPPKVLARAKTLLAELEYGAAGEGEEVGPLARRHLEKSQSQLSLFTPAPSAMEAALAKVDLDSLPPRQALEILYELKELLPKDPGGESQKH